MTGYGHAVLVVGGGPTGMMLAGELALAGVDVGIVERRADQSLAGSRAGGLHSRTLEVFDQRGIVDRFLSQGQTVQATAFGGTRLDLSDFPTRHPYSLGLWQNHIERILAEWVAELTVPVHRNADVVDVRQDEAGVDVVLAGGRSMRAGYVVGCDGGRSLVRRATGIDFPGWDATTSSLIAEVEMTGSPELGVVHDDSGVHGISRVDYQVVDGEVVYADSGPMRVMLTETEVGPATEPTLDDLREGLVRVFGEDYGIHSPTWISRFSDATRQAATYRRGRVLLAGDAAHIHNPVGGQGLNTGVQDAVNLGWKLARVVHGTSPERLLDSYHAERYPVAARVLRTTMAQIALRRRDDRTAALAATIADIVELDEPRKHLAAQMSGLDIRYDLGDGHPLVGRRMPDLDLIVDGKPLRTYTLLHAARPVLLVLDGTSDVDTSPWPGALQVITADHGGLWELPAIGEVPAPPAVLVRPDGYVAWVGEVSDPALTDAVATWFGSGVIDE